MKKKFKFGKKKPSEIVFQSLIFFYAFLFITVFLFFVVKYAHEAIRASS